MFQFPHAQMPGMMAQQMGMRGTVAVKRPAPVVVPAVAQLMPQLKKARTEGGVGEVRFETAIGAQQALSLNGANLAGSVIAVTLDERSKDGTKIAVGGLPAGLTWEELKTQFSACGKVVYANIKPVGGSGTPCAGAVRFETPEAAEQALQLTGSELRGHAIELRKHAGSKDGTKLQIFNLPSGIEWQELKDWFASAGIAVVFAEIGQAPGGSVTAEVRYDNPEHAKLALKELNGSLLAGGQIFLSASQMSPDGSKLVVTGVPPGIQWQELKDHFGQVGQVAFVNILTGKGGPGKGKGKGMMMNPFMAMMGGGMGMMNPFMGGMGAMGFGGKGGKAGKGFKGPTLATAGARVTGAGVGEVRYDFPMHAMLAVQSLNGSVLNGGQIMVGFDPMSQDGSKLVVTGIPPGTGWQDLKDHFSWCGQVAFAGLKK